MSSGKKVILVTGGNGLAGSALKQVVKVEGHDDEEWHFTTRVDADLTYDIILVIMFIMQRYGTGSGDV